VFGLLTLLRDPSRACYWNLVQHRNLVQYSCCPMPGGSSSNIPTCFIRLPFHRFPMGTQCRYGYGNLEGKRCLTLSWPDDVACLSFEWNPNGEINRRSDWQWHDDLSVR
jgi:hypothetical protein